VGCGSGSASGFTAGARLLQGIFGFSDGCMILYGQGHRPDGAESAQGCSRSLNRTGERDVMLPFSRAQGREG